MTDCGAPEIQEAYDEVRNDNSPINWMLITYAEGSNDRAWALAGKGENGLDELKEKLDDNFRGFGYLRFQTGDELSKRTKFVMVCFIGSAVSQFKRTKMTVHRGDVTKVINQYAINVDASDPEELTEEDIMDRLKRAGGANYNN